MSATEYNADFARRHGFFGGLYGCPHPVDSALFVGWVRDFQLANGLRSDGHFGPSTLATFRRVEGPPIPVGTVPVAGLAHGVPGMCDRVVNWYGEHGLRAQGRWIEDRLPTEIVVHESVTPSRDSTFRAFSRRRKYTDRRGNVRTYRAGTHLLIDADGTLYVLGDMVFDSLNHVPGGHNVESVGIEIVNPYEPSGAPDSSPWTDVLKPARWAHGREYLCATVEQCATLASVIRWLLCVVPTISHKWVGVDCESGTFALDRIDKSRKFSNPSPGIWSHQQIGGHSDAGFPTLVAYIIIECGVCPDDAHEIARELCTTNGKVANIGRI